MDGYPILDASAKAWRAHKDKPNQNPGLIFDRFAPDWSGDATLKKEGLEAVRKAAERADRDLLVQWNARWQATVRAAHADPFSLKTDWRFVTGLGRKGPLEAGFTFHRYGFPILPGSSVKGITRAYASLVAGRAESDPDFVAIFGRAPQKGEDESMAQSGGAVFFDAIPSKVPTLQLDIMNPHYPDYYGDKQGKTPPADWQSPRPVYFLTVAPNTEFCFAVGWRGAWDDEGRRRRDLAKEWLECGLKELGAGAKTSAGYGYFVKSEVVAKPISRQAASAASISPPKPPPPAVAEPQVWHTGIVREYQPNPGQGRLVDIKTGEELRFNRQAIEEKGWSPGGKAQVLYAVEEHEGRKRVVKVRRKR
ncbi:MAG: type III-B CRISPR module RAMP protein Cmr6 [Anaerolineae bacterium]|nr:type III-B CRISPR module RAMP protein Cmr6 [Anaerolineae bacterium]